MTIFETIASYSIMIILAYSIIAIPRCIGELQGLYQETIYDEYGHKTDLKLWKHGIRSWHLVVGVLIVMPIIIVIQDVVMNSYGIIASAIVVFLIVAAIDIIGRRKAKVNQALIEQIPEDQRMPKLKNKGLIGAIRLMSEEIIENKEKEKDE